MPVPTVALVMVQCSEVQHHVCRPNDMVLSHPRRQYLWDLFWCSCPRYRMELLPTCTLCLILESKKDKACQHCPLEKQQLMSKYQVWLICAEKNGLISSVQGTAFEKWVSRKLWNMLLVLPILNHMNTAHTVTFSLFNTHLNPFPFTYNIVCTCMLFPRHSMGAILFSILICFTVGLSFTLQFFQFLWMIVDGRKWYFCVLDWLRKKWRGLGILVNSCDMGSGYYNSNWLFEKWLYFVLVLCYFEICTDNTVGCSSHSAFLFCLPSQ
jgi:hypothetical protein